MSETTEQEALESTLTASQRHELALMRARVRDLETIATLGERVKELEDELKELKTPKATHAKYGDLVEINLNGHYLGHAQVDVENEYVDTGGGRIASQKMTVNLRMDNATPIGASWQGEHSHRDVRYRIPAWRV